MASNKKVERINVRFTPEEFRLLKRARRRSSHRTISAFVRFFIIKIAREVT